MKNEINENKALSQTSVSKSTLMLMILFGIKERVLEKNVEKPNSKYYQLSRI